jgi:subtilisin family serine protease
MKHALLKASTVGLLIIIILPLLALMSTSSAQDSKVVRVVVGYEDEGVIGKLTTIPGIAIIKILRDLRAAVLLTPTDKLDLIKSLKGVRYVEEDGVAKALEISASSDVLWNVRMINATDVWDSYYNTYGWSALGKGIVIAVLDTGIDHGHPELRGKIAWCVNTVGTRTYTGSNLRNCADRNGHGTHVAGIIASTINNVGNAGVAPNVTLYAVKVLNDNGLGFYSDIAEGIVLAVKGPDGVPGTSDDARILSMSLGGSSNSSVLFDATRWAYEHGAVLVAAAGNEGDGNPATNNVAYPARYPWVIAVAAVDRHYNVPTWSSDGPEVDVAAPGVRVYSTYRNRGYAELSGTSMATPHVSATVALIQALRVASGKSILDPDTVYKIITATAIDIGPPGFDVYSGYGLVDAIAAVNKALNLP